MLTKRWTPLKPHEVQRQLYQTDSRFVVVPSGRRSGKCLAEGSYITMADGTWKKIEDVRVNEHVLSIDFNNGYKIGLKPVKHVLFNGLKETLIIKTRSRTLTCTPNHPFLIDNEWVEAKDIKEGQLLGVVKETNIFNDLVMDKNELDFLAIWLAEGKDYTISNGNSIICERIFEIADDWDLVIKHYPKVDYFLGVKKRNGHNITTNKARLFLESLNLWGKNSKTKFIPDVVFKLGWEQTARFLNLFLCCDGYLHRLNDKRSPGFSIGLANELLVKQLSFLFSKFGIYGSIYHKISKKKDKKGRFFESWNFVTTDTKSVLNFCKYIGMTTKQKQVQETLETVEKSKGTNNVNFLPLYYKDILKHLKYEPIKSSEKDCFSRFTKGHIPKSKKLYDVPSELNKEFKWLRKENKRITYKKYEKIKNYTDGFFDNLFYGDVSWESVQSIEKGPVCKTYDLTVEGNHNFLVENAVTHNTELAKRKMVELCITYDGPCEDYRLFCAAPTRDQAKRIYWADIKALSPRWCVKKIYESDLIIRYINGSEIHIIGMDKPERVEGTPWDGGVLDEYANMKAKTWFEHVRPALADRRGFCWFIGVPEGRNHYYDLYKNALIDSTKEWNAFHWFSADILPEDEIRAAKRDLDLLTYQQEMEGSFVNFTGRAYYSFDERYHYAELQHIPNAPLIVCFDFNVSPGVAVICQEYTMLNEDGLPIMDESITGVIGEVYIPNNSNTEMVCRKIVYDWAEKHKGLIYMYGDATGGSGGSAKLSGNDWDIVVKMFSQGFGLPRIHLKVPRFNPSERSRINAVNSRLKSYEGIIRMFVDARKCPNLVKDFEGVRLVEGGSGEIDKKHDPKLSHLTDALGYYIVKEFPVRERKSDTIQYYGV